MSIHVKSYESHKTNSFTIKRRSGHLDCWVQDSGLILPSLKIELQCSKHPDSISNHCELSLRNVSYANTVRSIFATVVFVDIIKLHLEENCLHWCSPRLLPDISVCTVRESSACSSFAIGRSIM